MTKTKVALLGSGFIADIHMESYHRFVPDAEVVAVYARNQEKAKAFAEKHNIPGTVGSDAHAAFELGRSVLLLERFEGPDEMRKVIRQAKVRTKLSPWWVHLISRYASMKKKMS